MACVLEHGIDRPRLDLIEWGSIFQFLEDRRMAMSFAAAVQTDGHILAEIQVKEDNASKDRDIARRWTDDECIVPSAELDSESYTYSTMSDYGIIRDINTADTEYGRAESSAQATRRARHSLPPARRGVACREQIDFVNVVGAPCRHEYCRSFPIPLPRCCRQPINLITARIFLESDLVEQYEKKRFETPNRTYCYSSDCGAFINISYINGEQPHTKMDGNVASHAGEWWN
ncbi:hypothetical protein BJX68DRAFT_259150 [Aspergillus pseudodeflectus]|uniref:Uncharacterized protein n=1 Tax=Aspergillus pseudodeflectus TaxID=176178 RepID=A0ABR4JF75_9EURO